jgi:hypothetical protein
MPALSLAPFVTTLFFMRSSLRSPRPGSVTQTAFRQWFLGGIGTSGMASKRMVDAADDAPVVRDDFTPFFDSFAIDLDVVVSFQLRTRVNEVLRSALHQDHCQQPIMVARILAKGDVVAEAAGFLSGVWAQVAQVAELEGGECSIKGHVVSWFTARDRLARLDRVDGARLRADRCCARHGCGAFPGSPLRFPSHCPEFLLQKLMGDEIPSPTGD